MLLPSLLLHIDLQLSSEQNVWWLGCLLGGLHNLGLCGKLNQVKCADQTFCGCGKSFAARHCRHNFDAFSLEIKLHLSNPFVTFCGPLMSFYRTDHWYCRHCLLLLFTGITDLKNRHPQRTGLR